MSARALAFAFACVVASSSGAAAAGKAPTHDAKRAFGPFDAGAARPVKRQGATGKARREFPSVGDVAKVPGEGPPPPPLRPDSDIPEGALDKVPGGGPNAVGAGLSSNPLYLAALAYQHVLTKLDGPRCSHLPTCSRFASQAVARHGAVGILMGLDRVIQPNESSAIRRLPEVEGWGAVRVFDPLENYEWWHPERFTGLPPSTPEQPLALPPLPGRSR